MKLWLKRISVTLITMMTLGLYIPPVYLTPNAEENREEDTASERDTTEDILTTVAEPSRGTFSSHLGENEINHSETFIHTFTDEVKEKTLTKLGPKIADQVADEFTSDIFPSMEEALEDILETGGD